MAKRQQNALHASQVGDTAKEADKIEFHTGPRKR